MKSRRQGVASEKIRGIEQEYPVSAKANLNPSMLVNAAILGLKRRGFSYDVIWDTATEISQEVHESRIASSYGNNGCRIYNDMGHLEIATPSYSNPIDAMAYEKASEIYALVGAREASLALKKEVLVHRNNVANIVLERGARRAKRVKTITYATHGNIITLREACKDWSMVERALIPWVITRIIFTGAGDVVSGEFVGREGAKFVISPRAMFVARKSSLSTTVDRGILNTRDQPHAARRYWRLHDIHYEGLRCEYSIFLRDIAQALVICAFEAGLLESAPEIEDPVRTFKMISADTQECEWKIKLKTGEVTDAVSILKFYLDAMEKVSREHGGDEWEESGLKCMGRLLDRFEARRIEDYVDGIDWVTKLALLVNYEPKSASEGVSICNQYALLDENLGFYLKDRDTKIKGASLFNPKESLAFAERELPGVDMHSYTARVRRALFNAPEQTREFFKAEMMKRHRAHVRSLSWSTMVLNEAKILLDEPFMLCKDEIGSCEAKDVEASLSMAKRLYPEKVIY